MGINNFFLLISGSLTPPINYYRANFVSGRRSDEERKKHIDISAPGLFMFGELDDYLVLDHLDIGKKYVKKLETRIVKGANHFVQQDDPETVNEYMREFLKSTS